MKRLGGLEFGLSACSVEEVMDTGWGGLKTFHNENCATLLVGSEVLSGPRPRLEESSLYDLGDRISSAYSEVESAVACKSCTNIRGVESLELALCQVVCFKLFG